MPIIIYLVIGLVIAFLYLRQIAPTDDFELKYVTRILFGWVFLWPVILGVILIWKAIERASK